MNNKILMDFSRLVHEGLKQEPVLKRHPDNGEKSLQYFSKAWQIKRILLKTSFNKKKKKSYWCQYDKQQGEIPQIDSITEKCFLPFKSGKHLSFLNTKQNTKYVTKICYNRLTLGPFNIPRVDLQPSVFAVVHQHMFSLLFWSAVTIIHYNWLHF